MLSQEETKIPRYNINETKIYKYIPRLINGEAYMLDKWLANLMTTTSGITGITEREGYGYWLSQHKSKAPHIHNSLFTQLAQAIENRRKIELANKQQALNGDQEIMRILSHFKNTIDQFHENSNR